MTEQRVTKDPRRLNMEESRATIASTKAALEREEWRFARLVGHMLLEGEREELQQEFNTTRQEDLRHRQMYKVQGLKTLLELLEDNRPRCHACGVGGRDRASDV